MIISHSAIGHCIPRTAKTVYNDYCVGIDTDSTDELVGLMKNQSGLLSVAMDGVTNHRKSKTLVTATIGCVSMFVKWVDHGSDVHVTDAEVESGVEVCKEIMEMFGGLGIACIAVDNAARKMADRIIERLKELGLFPFTLRDPVHCLDLLMKDFLKCLFVEPIIAEGKEVNEFVLRNRIDNIRLDMISARQLTGSHAGRVCYRIQE